MGHRDYCITMIDKVVGVFRYGEDIPNRRVDYDALRFAYRDDSDPVTASYPGLPAKLELWEEVTKPGMFFDPQVLGFLYVEVYDPEYWMDYNMVDSKSCFHPMYRMRTRNTRSAIDRTVVALWVDKYSHIVPDVDEGIAKAARSVHFGFPLWFFDRSAVDSIATVILDEWGILEE